MNTGGAVVGNKLAGVVGQLVETIIVSAGGVDLRDSSSQCRRRSHSVLSIRQGNGIAVDALAFQPPRGSRRYPGDMPQNTSSAKVLSGIGRG